METFEGRKKHVSYKADGSYRLPSNPGGKGTPCIQCAGFHAEGVEIGEEHEVVNRYESLSLKQTQRIRALRKRTSDAAQISAVKHAVVSLDTALLRGELAVSTQDELTAGKAFAEATRLAQAIAEAMVRVSERWPGQAESA